MRLTGNRPGPRVRRVAGGSGIVPATGDHPFGYGGMRKTYRPPVKMRRERRWLVRREHDDELNERDAILNLGCEDKQAVSDTRSA